MFRSSLIFGSLAGIVVITATLIFIAMGGSDHNTSPLFGYLIMLVALSLIFVGTKRYRDLDGGGVIRFLPALALGLGIAVVASVIYTVVWEFYLALTHSNFIDQYAAAVIAQKKAAGVSGAALQAEIAQMNDLKAQYANPVIRMGMTFMEIFPVGLIIALISAALLRNPKLLPAR